MVVVGVAVGTFPEVVVLEVGEVVVVLEVVVRKLLSSIEPVPSVELVVSLYRPAFVAVDPACRPTVLLTRTDLCPSLPLPLPLPLLLGVKFPNSLRLLARS